MKIQVKLNDELKFYTINEFSKLPTGTLGQVINLDSNYYGKVVVNDPRDDLIVLLDHTDSWRDASFNDSKVKMFRKLDPEESITISNG